MKREHDDMNDEQGIESLLRQVGRRDEPSPKMMEEVRQAVHEEWRTVVSQRKRRRRTFAFGMAASISLAIAIGSWTLHSVTSPNVGVTIAHIDRDAQISSPSDLNAELEVGDAFAIGEVLTTDDATRMALAFGPHTSMRLDRSSRLQRLSADRFRLSAGAVYVDAQPHVDTDGLIIETVAGEVQHLGTQYQIRHAQPLVEVSVREGRVEITNSEGAVLGSAGELLRMTASGQVDRRPISAQDPSWDWAEATAPPFVIDDHTLAEFLEWTARETGRKLVYESPAAQRAAETLNLRGSIEGLDPNTALSAVLATTELEVYNSADALLGIRLPKSKD